MFSKKDFLEYFEQVREMEVEMVRLVSILASDVNEPYLKHNFQDILKDEARHANEIKEIVEIIRLNC